MRKLHILIILGASLMTGALWALSYWVRPLRNRSFVIGILATALLAATGFFGGIIAYG
jgi:hypothetical protein